jgi:hypothetical protein
MTTDDLFMSEINSHKQRISELEAQTVAMCGAVENLGWKIELWTEPSGAQYWILLGADGKPVTESFNDYIHRREVEPLLGALKDVNDRPYTYDSGRVSDTLEHWHKLAQSKGWE